MIFTDVKRAEVKGGLPEGEKSGAHISKAMGKLWKALPDEEKKPFVEVRFSGPCAKQRTWRPRSPNLPSTAPRWRPPKRSGTTRR